jgi:uncharacterized alkaline shock family protein YloU
MTPPSRRHRRDRAAETPHSAGAASQGEDQVERLADAVATAVRRCSAVARLAAGPVATYLPGRLVRGVAVRGGDVTVAVVARYGPPLPRVAAEVRTAVREIDPGLRVEVMIEDVDLPAAGTSPRTSTS